MKRLTLLYDASCPICVRCRDWIETQRSFVPIELLAASSAEARRRYGEVPWLGEELVVASDDGEVWAGAAAFLVALWALEDYREWSYRLTGNTLSKVAERFFAALSHRRKWLSGWFAHPSCTKERCHRQSAPAATYR
jgi:predicted DCC family thiol-disulfide oxidoreductase YuxK